MKLTTVNELDGITSHQGYHAGYKDEISRGDSHAENEMCATTTEGLRFGICSSSNKLTILRLYVDITVSCDIDTKVKKLALKRMEKIHNSGSDRKYEQAMCRR